MNNHSITELLLPAKYTLTPFRERYILIFEVMRFINN
jgi:hypothetical protein